MNLIDHYLVHYTYIRNYSWMINNLYIHEDQRFLPTKGQKEILLTTEDKKAFLLPRNSGSSTLICMDAITEALLNDKTNIIIFCPIPTAVNHLARQLNEILQYSSIRTRSRNTNRFLFMNQSEIKIIYPHNSNYRGYQPHAIYIDSFDMVNSEELSNIFNRMIHYAEKILILGNDINNYETTQKIININPRKI